MWDQQLTRMLGPDSERIIPTYVGSTTTMCGKELRTSNHSHVCGINDFIMHGGDANDESFPRMWDQRLTNCESLLFSRIIPTYVGSTVQNSTVFPFCSNHSHVCGINGAFFALDGLNCESFPRMWDQLHRRMHRSFFMRIIPTYVGSTRIQQTADRDIPNHSHVCGINTRFSHSSG